MANLAALYPEDGFFAKLTRAAAAEWTAYTHHPFVAGLADGTLAAPKFRHYLIQDYLFLIQFSRAYGLAVYKSGDPLEMRAFAGSLDAILNREMDLHVGQAALWGLTPQDLAETPEAATTVAYTRFVLDCGLGGDLLDLAVALSPCTVGYGVIGRRIAPLAAPDTPYRAWIDAYGDAGYQDIARNAALRLEGLAATRGGAARFDALARTFAKASALEAAFWEMAWVV